MLPEVVMYQRWNDLLFLHWEVDPDHLRRFVPDGLDLDLFDGRAWVGLIPFTMEGIRTRFLPPLPGLTALHEVNLRTYVRHEVGPGVWFFSLDAMSRIAVQSARLFYRLPYHYAAIGMNRRDGWIDYEARRSIGDESVHVRYRGLGSPEPVPDGTLEHFLIERYRLFASRGERLWSARVYHDPYPVEQGEFRGLTENLLPRELEIAGDPLMAHYSRGVSVQIGRLRPVR